VNEKNMVTMNAATFTVFIIAANVSRLADVPVFYNCQPETEADKKPKYKIYSFCSPAFGQLKLS
jgi:hypothetical protein